MRLVFLGLALLAACATTGHTRALRFDNPAVDSTGADVAHWDSLSRTYYNGPVPIDPLPFLVPVPRSMRRTQLVAVIGVDETGRVTRISMKPTRDREYGARLMGELLKATFRPAITRDGTPTRGYYMLWYSF
jgi:hypothetical protein